MKRSRVSNEEMTLIRQLFYRDNMSYSDISRKLNRHVCTVWQTINPRSGITAAARIRPDTMVIPDEVLDERDRRINAKPRNLSALISGGPPIRYSALERRA